MWTWLHRVFVIHKPFLLLAIPLLLTVPSKKIYTILLFTTPLLLIQPFFLSPQPFISFACCQRHSLPTLLAAPSDPSSLVANVVDAPPMLAVGVVGGGTTCCLSASYRDRLLLPPTSLSDDSAPLHLLSMPAPVSTSIDPSPLLWTLRTSVVSAACSSPSSPL